MSGKDACRRWIIAISQLKSRAAKVRRGGVAQDTTDLVEQSLSLCDGIVRDLAGAGLQLDESRVRLDTQIAPGRTSSMKCRPPAWRPMRAG